MKIKHKLWIDPQKIDFYEMLINTGNHTLIAGTTGSGKSVLLNNCLDYLLCTQTPKEYSLILFDTKIVELQKYKNMLHVDSYLTDIIRINAKMRGLIALMNQRYSEMAKRNIVKWDGQRIVVIIDEIADILTAFGNESKKFKQYLTILLAKSRASGINFIVCTQAPNRKILSAEIVLNIPTRCALRCLSSIESRQIINVSGAENLPKYGQCILLSPDLIKPTCYSFGMVEQSTLNEHIKMWCKGGSMIL